MAPGATVPRQPHSELHAERRALSPCRLEPRDQDQRLLPAGPRAAVSPVEMPSIWLPKGLSCPRGQGQGCPCSSAPGHLSYCPSCGHRDTGTGGPPPTPTPPPGNPARATPAAQCQLRIPPASRGVGENTSTQPSVAEQGARQPRLGCRPGPRGSSAAGPRGLRGGPRHPWAAQPGGNPVPARGARGAQSSLTPAAVAAPSAPAGRTPGAAWRSPGSGGAACPGGTAAGSPSVGPKPSSFSMPAISLSCWARKAAAGSSSAPAPSDEEKKPKSSAMAGAPAALPLGLRGSAGLGWARLAPGGAVTAAAAAAGGAAALTSETGAAPLPPGASRSPAGSRRAAARCPRGRRAGPQRGHGGAGPVPVPVPLGCRSPAWQRGAGGTRTPAARALVAPRGGSARPPS